jgi:two-component system, LytTR family, sensor kinase
MAQHRQAGNPFVRADTLQQVDYTRDETLRPWLTWVVSFGVWTVIGLAETVSRYQYQKSLGFPITLYDFGVPLVNSYIWALLTPPVLSFATRYPVERNHIARRFLGYFLGGVLFTIVHVVLRGVLFPVRDPRVGQVSTVGWLLFKRLFLAAGTEDMFQIYMPIVVFGQMIAYYQRFKNREVQLAEAQLEALKSRLQPHFLFNTLNSISALMFSDVKAADKMMSRLGDLLRSILEEGGIQETTLSKELQFLDMYVQIEKIRFDGRLEVVIYADPATLDAHVPQLLLQPLVENAIHHGIAKLSGGGTVRVTSFHDCTQLHLRITDNGRGLEPASNALGQRHGVGLTATRIRLQALYGDSQDFSVDNVPEGGVEVSIDIPFSVEAMAVPQVSKSMLNGAYAES